LIGDDFETCATCRRIFNEEKGTLVDLNEETKNGNLSECYLFGRQKGLNMTYGTKMNYFFVF
jgi:hypothetical protein